MEIKHKKFGSYILKVDDITQGQLEKYYDELYKINPDAKSSSVIQFTGDTVRALVKVGLIDPVIDVYSASPALIRWVSQEFNNSIAKILDIDPN